MQISKLSSTQISEESKQAQSPDSKPDSQQAESVGLSKSDSIETLKSDHLADIFAHSPESGLVAYSGSGNAQQLGNSGNPATASESYAAQKDSGAESSASESINQYEAIRKEVADALGVAENDPAVDKQLAELAIQQRAKQDADRMAANQQIIDDAITNGRRVDQMVKIGDQEVHMFDEFVPSPSGDLKDTVLRQGLDYVDHGFFGDSTRRITTYHDAAGKQLGTVESLIEGGEEKITQVIENVAGSIALKPGDTRTVPTSTTGKSPSTWDPQPDGRYGSASKGGSSSSNNNTTNTSNSSSGSENTNSSNSGATGGGGVGLHDQFFDGAHQKPDSGSKGSSTSGTATPAAGTANPETRAGAVHTYSSKDSGKTWEDKGTSWTENPPTEVEVTYEEPETEEGLAEEAEVNQNDEDGYQAGWGDYAETGPTPPPSTGSTIESTSGSGSGYHLAHESDSPFTETGSTLTDSSGYADKPGGPSDYGNANDPNANPDQPPDLETVLVKAHVHDDPTVTDPANPGEEELSALNEGSIHMDMAGTLRNTGNPNDPRTEGDPVPNRPKTGDAE